MMVAENGTQPEEAPQNGRLKSGIEDTLGLDRSGGFGFGFNAILEMSRGSLKAEEWRVRTEYSEREIGINAMRAGRRHRARFGWTNTELIDWNKAHDRVSLGRKGRKEIKEMFIAEKQRFTPMREQNSSFDRMTGGNQNPEPMRLK